MTENAYLSVYHQAVKGKDIDALRLCKELALAHNALGAMLQDFFKILT